MIHDDPLDPAAVVVDVAEPPLQEAERAIVVDYFAPDGRWLTVRGCPGETFDELAAYLRRVWLAQEVVEHDP